MVKRARRGPGWAAFTGFMMGVCMAFVIGLITIPRHIELTRSIYVGREDKAQYLREFNNYQLEKTKSSSSSSDSEFSELEYLQTQSPLLCFIIEEISNDFIMINQSVNTWMRTCDKSLVFYRTPYLPQRFNASSQDSRRPDFVSYPDTKRGLDLLISTLANLQAHYRWFVYVPHSVYLVPYNLQYYLTSSFINPKHTAAFFGKVDVGLASDRISVKSPFVMSLAAVLSAQLRTNLLIERSITDMKSLINISNGNLYGLVNSQHQDVFKELQLAVLDRNPSHANVTKSIPLAYPASVYLGKNEFKYYVEMHYYISRLQAFGRDMPFDRNVGLETITASNTSRNVTKSDQITKT